MTIEAILYARFSPRPNEEECESVERQLERCRAYCAAHGYVVAGEYFDKAISGKDIHSRKGFQEAMKRAMIGKRMLVVTDLDRLSRTTKDALLVADDLQAAHAHLAIISLQIDTTTPVGEMIYTVLAALAQMQRKQTAARTRAAMLRHQQNGRRMSKRTPFGWQPDAVNHALMVRDEDEQAIIAWILEEHARGKGMRTICRELTEEGITCRGGAWYHQTVKAILRRSGAIVAY